MVTLEGPDEVLRVVLIEFPSMQQARAFYDSDDYDRTKKLRAGAGSARFVVIDGYPAEKWEEVAEESSKLELP